MRGMSSIFFVNQSENSCKALGVGGLHLNVTPRYDTMVAYGKIYMWPNTSKMQKN